jgi:hypothetical protein
MKRRELPANCGDFCGDSCGVLGGRNRPSQPCQGRFAGTAGTLSESLCTRDDDTYTCTRDTCYGAHARYLIDCNKSPQSPQSPQGTHSGAPPAAWPVEVVSGRACANSREVLR